MSHRQSKDLDQGVEGVVVDATAVVRTHGRCIVANVLDGTFVFRGIVHPSKGWHKFHHLRKHHGRMEHISENDMSSVQCKQLY